MLVVMVTLLIMTMMNDDWIILKRMTNNVEYVDNNADVDMMKKWHRMAICA